MTITNRLFSENYFLICRLATLTCKLGNNFQEKVCRNNAKFEGKFDVKRGSQEPWLPFQTMKLLEEILRKDKVVHRASMTFKAHNRNLRELVAQLTQQQKSNEISNRRKN